ncbi:NAD(P)/FAD-dependent oxidoreductase [Actinomadura sp. 21ATH]|uniref:NAD(P)/FAD-dependent oxidoreductase n=1 Tax=Actinomadura sp. 21ATH TaxID=1735444 RepID=UPI0035BF5237
MDVPSVPLAPDFDAGGTPYWSRALGDAPPGERLPGPMTADVCVVGAGCTGLWTAYYLKRADPGLRVVVLERGTPGHGASGAGGGRLSGESPAACARLARRHGRFAVIALQRALFETVDEIVRVAVDEGVEADLLKSGLLYVARNPAQLARLETHVRLSRTWGWAERDLHLDTLDRVNVAGAAGAAWSPHGARVQPAALVRGLARAAAGLGVEIYEHTPVLRIRPRSSVSPAAAATPHGTVAAEYVIRATEGFTAALEGHHRDWLPMTTSMIVTTPLPAGSWAEIGWEGAELLADLAHAGVRLQRTADGRVAVGGRGRPYRYGSRVADSGRTDPGAVAALWRALVAMFPAASAASVAGAWSGLLGVPRDRCPSVTLDHRTGLGHAGGFALSGLTASNLAARTLRDLLLEHDTPLTALPWVHWRNRRWEPEPLRWLGIQAGYALYRAADAHERSSASPKTSPLARLAAVLTRR